jgi:hypothetical protein
MKRVLISHSWDHGESYEKLCELLSRHGYEFFDHSIASSEPLSANGEDDLRRRLANRIAEVSTVLVMVTDDAHEKPGVQLEVEEAVRQQKRLIAVWPWGKAETPVPRIVDDNAHAIVSFRGNEVIDAIEGEDIRRLPSYFVSETEDIKTLVSWIVNAASAATIVGCVAAHHVIPRINDALKLNGYMLEVEIEKPLPTASQVLAAAAVGALIAVIIVRVAGWRWLKTIALLGGAGGALWRVGRSVRLQTKVGPDGFCAQYRVIR